jgi:hypothetical protein
MGKRRLLLMDSMSNLVAFLVLFNIFAFVFAMDNGRLDWIYLLMAAPFALMLFLRKKIKKMRYFLASHLVVPVLPFAAWPDMRIFVMLMVFAVIATFYSIHRRSKGEWNMQGTSAVLVIAFLAAMSVLYATYLPDIAGIGILLNISSLISLAAVVLYMHLDNMQFSMDLIGIAHHGNVSHSSSVSNVLIAVFLIIIVIFGALSVLFPSEAAILVIGRLLVDIVLLPLRFLVFVLQGIGGEELLLEDAPLEPLILGEALFEFEGLPEEESHPFYGIISAVVQFLAVLGVLVAVTAAVATIFYRLYLAFRRKKRPERHSLMPDDTVSKLKFVLGDLKELLPRFRLGTRHPVRRAYIKKVNSHIKTGLDVRPHYTPEVIADKIRPKEDIDELTQRYQKVRYGKG